MQTQTSQEFIVTWRLKYADAGCVGHNAHLFYLPVVAADRTVAVESTREKAVQTAQAWCLEHGIGDRFFANAMAATTVETPAEHRESEKSEARNEKETRRVLVWFAIIFGGLLAIFGGLLATAVVISDLLRSGS